MSAQRNKQIDFDKREQNKSVVQRFITDDSVPEQNQEQADIRDSPDINIIKKIIPPLKADEGYNTQAITAQLEKLESRFEQFESKVGGLDSKLDKLDGLADLERRLEANLERKAGQSSAPGYILFNVMEEAVKEEVRATMNNMSTCRCEKCYHDVCALVLNNMVPQYATTQEGVLMKKAKTLLNIDVLTKLSGEIFGAIDKVKNKPDHK